MHRCEEWNANASSSTSGSEERNSDASHRGEERNADASSSTSGGEERNGDVFPSARHGEGCLGLGRGDAMVVDVRGRGRR